MSCEKIKFVTSVNGETGDVVIKFPDTSYFYTKSETDIMLNNKTDKTDFYALSDSYESFVTAQGIFNQATNESINSLDVLKADKTEVIAVENKIPTKLSQLEDNVGYALSSNVVDIQTYNEFVKAQETIDSSQTHLIEVLENSKANRSELPDMNNYYTKYETDIVVGNAVKVKSVNGQTGNVVIDIPKYTSQLINNSEFVTINDLTTLATKQQLNEEVTKLNESINLKANKTEIPDVSIFNPTNNFKTINNESIIGTGNIHIEGGGVTSVNGQTGDVVIDIPTVPTNVSAFNNDAGYLTEHQDISNLATKDELNEKADKSELNDYALKTDIPTIPENVSAFNNDAGYLTEHQDISNLATKDELNEKADKDEIPDVSIFNPTDNFKTVNGESIIGTGDITIQGGGVTSVNGQTGDVVIDIPTDYVTNNTFNQFVDNQTIKNKELDDKISEIELFKFPNVTIIGEPTIQNGQISGFSAENYTQFPFLVDFHNQAFEINMCFTTGNNVTTQENIFDSIDGLAFAVRNGRFVIAMSSDGQTWNMGEHIGSQTVTPNTTYYVKFSWNRLIYKLEVSTDKIDYVTDIQVTDTRSLYAKQIIIGKSIDNQYVFGGSINLNNCSLSIMGQVVWQGMDDAGLATRLATDLSNIDNAGEQKIKSIVGVDELVTYDYVEEHYTPLSNFNTLNNAYNQFVQTQTAKNQEVDNKLSNTITLTATLEDETTVSYKIYGEQII